VDFGEGDHKIYVSLMTVHKPDLRHFGGETRAITVAISE